MKKILAFDLKKFQLALRPLLLLLVQRVLKLR